MKKIIVCGDSFCTSVKTDRYHFSQLLADKYNYDVINLAHGGFSNIGICFQIREAIGLNPDIIIYNTTDHTRFELIMNGNFHINNGLKNIVYFQPAAESFDNPVTGNPGSPVWLTNHTRLVDPDISIRKDHREAADIYVKYFLDYELKKETASWAVGYWHQQIVTAGIIPLRVSPEDELAKPMYEYAQNNQNCRAYYHTDPATQEIVAGNIAKELEKLLKIDCNS